MCCIDIGGDGMECARQRYNLGHFISPFLWKMIVKMLTHIHMVVYTWWCWHICKGEEVGVDVDQLGEETEAKGDTHCV